MNLTDYTPRTVIDSRLDGVVVDRGWSWLKSLMVGYGLKTGNDRPVVYPVGPQRSEIIN